MRNNTDVKLSNILLFFKLIILSFLLHVLLRRGKVGSHRSLVKQKAYNPPLGLTTELIDPKIEEERS